MDNLPPKVIKVYAIHPGHVQSKNDEDVHYIGYGQLIKLYGLRPYQCIMWDDDSPETFRAYKEKDYIHLYPSYHGDYTLEKED